MARNLKVSVLVAAPWLILLWQLIRWCRSRRTSFQLAGWKAKLQIMFQLCWPVSRSSVLTMQVLAQTAVIETCATCGASSLKCSLVKFRGRNSDHQWHCTGCWTAHHGGSRGAPTHDVDVTEEIWWPETKITCDRYTLHVTDKCFPNGSVQDVIYRELLRQAGAKIEDHIDVWMSPLDFSLKFGQPDLLCFSSPHGITISGERDLEHFPEGMANAEFIWEVFLQMLSLGSQRTIVIVVLFARQYLAQIQNLMPGEEAHGRPLAIVSDVTPFRNWQPRRSNPSCQHPGSAFLCKSDEVACLISDLENPKRSTLNLVEMFCSSQHSVFLGSFKCNLELQLAEQRSQKMNTQAA